MSKVEQTIIERLKEQREYGLTLDAKQLTVGTRPATRRTLASMTRRGLVTRIEGVSGEYRYSLA